MRPGTELFKERREFALKVLRNAPLNGVGQVDWQTIWKRHPGMQQKLKLTTEEDRKRLSTIVANLRKQGLVPRPPAPGSSNGPLPQAPVQVPAAPATPAPLDETQKRDLLKAIVQNYSTAKGVAWQRVFRDHPEYRTLLGADKSNSRGMQWLYYHATQMRKRLKAEAPPKVEEVPHYTDGMPHCPTCGEPMAAWNRAFNAKMNLAAK